MVIDGRSPIFLQTGFRTGGTWLWSRFRARQACLCFCEPLNEALESITPSTIAGLTPESSNLHHPTLEAPYFDEFRSLLNDNETGIRGYKTEFGLNSYFAPPAQQPVGLTDYLQSLLDLAAGQGRQPVLKFTRAVARAAWLKSCFPDARQIFMVRDPWLQFQSGLSLARNHDNYTFLMIPLFAISRPQHGALDLLSGSLGLPKVPFSSGIATCAGTYTRLAREMSRSDLFQAFLGMSIASHALCAPFADLVVVQEMLVESPRYRQTIESAIRASTGMSVDLSQSSGVNPLNAGTEPDFDIRGASQAVYEIFGDEYLESTEYMRQRLSHLG